MMSVIVISCLIQTTWITISKFHFLVKNQYIVFIFGVYYIFLFFFQEGGKTIKATEAKIMMDVRSCGKWDREKWNLTLQNFPEILQADCLKAAPTDLLLEK